MECSDKCNLNVISILHPITGSTTTPSTTHHHSQHHQHQHKSRQQKQDQRAHVELMTHYTSATRQIENLICTNRESLIGEWALFVVFVLIMFVTSVVTWSAYSRLYVLIALYGCISVNPRMHSSYMYKQHHYHTCTPLYFTITGSGAWNKEFYGELQSRPFYAVAPALLCVDSRAGLGE